MQKTTSNLRKLFLIGLTGLVFGSSSSVVEKQGKSFSSQKEDFEKYNLIKAFKNGDVANFTDFIEKQNNFEYDTLKINKQNAKKRTCLGQYIPIKNKVEIKFFLTDYTEATKEDSALIKKFEMYNLAQFVNSVKAHELSHQMFHNNGKIKKLSHRPEINDDFIQSETVVPLLPSPKLGFVIKVGDLSLSDLAIIGQYNEIGAEIGRRIYERERYQKTRNINEFFKYDAYVDAIKKGEINPCDTTPAARNKEYALLATAVFENWIKKEKNNYRYTSYKDVRQYIAKAQKEDFIIPEQSVESVMKARVRSCFTFPLDNQLRDLSVFIQHKQMSPQPYVQKAIADYEANNVLYQVPKSKTFLNQTLAFSLNSKRSR